MKRLSLIASALAVLGLTACEKGLVEDIADVGNGQVANSVLQVRTRNDTRDRYTVTQTLRSKARPASLQTGEMQNAPRRSSGTERAGTTKSKPLTASGGQYLTFAA